MINLPYRQARWTWTSTNFKPRQNWARLVIRHGDRGGGPGRLCASWSPLKVEGLRLTLAGFYSPKSEKTRPGGGASGLGEKPSDHLVLRGLRRCGWCSTPPWPCSLGAAAPATARPVGPRPQPFEQTLIPRGRHMPHKKYFRFLAALALACCLGLASSLCPGRQTRSWYSPPPPPPTRSVM